MIDTAARALLSLGCFVAVGSALMIPGTSAGTAERIVSIIALLLGIGIVIASVAAQRISTRRRHREDAMSDPTDDSVVTHKEET
ncbi:hypothetical protein ACFQS2_10130 [Brachybacterium sp. GCM10030267]|uniref:hypothetical protein n=1 Tax=unclassified Brachybacterium TaxID=2623841 RepID=UPI0036106514